ncbi:hypothetical protein M231_04728 [Tremella mesenterica]|uniref:NADP-dependent oxidoreductase domain-containing protein n=1 Tax=Tremella mesenterica TaxID=5217 RepID=A0A4Q1BK14_TREME|nr:hypothetical protein M231_04728 [Tremella mesenterica]
MSLTIESAVRLSSGAFMPRLGFGIFKATGKECEESVKVAAEVGYRHCEILFHSLYFYISISLDFWFFWFFGFVNGLRVILGTKGKVEKADFIGFSILIVTFPSTGVETHSYFTVTSSST